LVHTWAAINRQERCGIIIHVSCTHRRCLLCKRYRSTGKSLGSSVGGSGARRGYTAEVEKLMAEVIGICKRFREQISSSNTYCIYMYFCRPGLNSI
jgi:hypothetical protein